MSLLGIGLTDNTVITTEGRGTQISEGPVETLSLETDNVTTLSSVTTVSETSREDNSTQIPTQTNPEDFSSGTKVKL